MTWGRWSLDADQVLVARIDDWRAGLLPKWALWRRLRESLLPAPAASGNGGGGGLGGGGLLAAMPDDEDLGDEADNDDDDPKKKMTTTTTTTTTDDFPLRVNRPVILCRGDASGYRS